jgi:hypothetical protein
LFVPQVEVVRHDYRRRTSFESDLRLVA